MFLKIKRAQFNPNQEIVLEDIVINTDHILHYEASSNYVDALKYEHNLSKMIMISVQEQPINVYQLPSILNQYFNIVDTSVAFNSAANPCSISGGSPGFVSPVISYPYLKLQVIKNDDETTLKEIVLNTANIIWFESYSYFDVISRTQVDSAIQIIVIGDTAKRIICKIGFQELSNYLSTVTV